MNDATSVLVDTWRELRDRVEAALERYLAELRPDCPERLREAMGYSLLAGGKRLRPLLVILACEACGGRREAALPAACAIEMIHTYSLIHDDLPAMDDDELRRGRPTNHKVFGEAMAILAGDGLLTLAFEVLARDVKPPEVAAACCAELASAAGAEGMVGGQVADLEAEQFGPTDRSAEAAEWIGPSHRAEVAEPEPSPVPVSPSRELERLEAIHRRKTGRLLACALTLGARIAQAPPEMRDRLENYGRCLGLAFQITDDLLDILGDASKIGKKVQKDAGHGKLTYPGLLGVDESRARARALIEEACRWIAPLGEGGRRLDA
ncbi:MAG TPA: polyprenyl synthetase family protein, partial [Planctomycetaceae bacterium]|nr:polyprenyl synthetase family protein [Planctomycetaceae bacterium]